MSKKTILIVVILILALSGGLVGNHFYKKSKIHVNPQGTVGNTCGNLYNDGIFCEDDEYVYFANAYDNYTLYRMRADETEIEKIMSTQTRSLNIDSKYIYYYQSGSGGSAGLGYLINTTGIFRVEKSKSHTAICLDRTPGKYVILSDNNIYYTCTEDSVVLNKIDVNGKNKELLLESDILPASIQNSTLYYTNVEDNLHLMSYNLNTGVTRQVLTEDIYMPIIDGTVVYGIDIHNNYALIKTNLNDGSKQVLDTDRTDMLNVTDMYIYYQTSGENPQLKRIKKTGSEPEVVADGVYNKINATSEYVYFTRFQTDTPVYKTPISGPVNVTTFDNAFNAAAEQIKK